MSIAKPQTPPGIYFEQFGITERRDVVRITTANRCCLWVERIAICIFNILRQHRCAFLMAKVSRASSSLDLGMGVRVVVGDQVGYSFSEDLSPRCSYTKLQNLPLKSPIKPINYVVLKLNEESTYRVTTVLSSLGIVLIWRNVCSWFAIKNRQHLQLMRG